LVVARVSWDQALAWRMGRQLLDPVGELPVEDVVRRLCGVQAQVASSAELAIRVRQRSSQPGEVARALADGRLIKTWAMRGTLHLLTPQDAGASLTLMAAGRTWERPSWQRYFGMPIEAWARLRPVVREALDDGPLSREELITAIVAQPGLGHLGEALRAGWGTLLKPLAWQGDLCFGPSRGARVTFMRPESASSLWAGIPDPDEAGPVVIAAYLGGYGPAAPDNFHKWLARGWIGARRARAWFSDLGERVAEVDVEGDRRLILADDLDELVRATTTTSVRLLPGFDQYVLGPGTDDPHVIPVARRTAVSKQSGWIAPTVVANGVVAGTWELVGDEVRIAWFKEAARPRAGAVEDALARHALIADRALRSVLSFV
jgi:Winged helix DNA-binding domain